MFLRNILTILKVLSFLCVLATKMAYATNGTHLRHVHAEKPVTLTVHDLVCSICGIRHFGC
jgi:hypothetical protein